MHLHVHILVAKYINEYYEIKSYIFLLLVFACCIKSLGYSSLQSNVYSKTTDVQSLLLLMVMSLFGGQKVLIISH